MRGGGSVTGTKPTASHRRHHRRKEACPVTGTRPTASHRGHHRREKACQSLAPSPLRATNCGRDRRCRVATDTGCATGDRPPSTRVRSSRGYASKVLFAAPASTPAATTTATSATTAVPTAATSADVDAGAAESPPAGVFLAETSVSSASPIVAAQGAARGAGTGHGIAGLDSVGAASALHQHDRYRDQQQDDDSHHYIDHRAVPLTNAFTVRRPRNPHRRNR